MTNEQQFFTISSTSDALFKDRASKFYARAFPVKTLEDVENALMSYRKEHNKARHHCYAYRLGLEDDEFRIWDDGEPSGTAGKPIYNRLLSHQLTNVLVVVARYFGGTLLGTSGLINAYKTATEEALQANDIQPIVPKSRVAVTYDYQIYNRVEKYLSKNHPNVISREDANQGKITFECIDDDLPSFLITLKIELSGLYKEEVINLSKFDKFIIKIEKVPL